MLPVTLFVPSTPTLASSQCLRPFPATNRSRVSHLSAPRVVRRRIRCVATPDTDRRRNADTDRLDPSIVNDFSITDPLRSSSTVTTVASTNTATKLSSTPTQTPRTTETSVRVAATTTTTTIDDEVKETTKKQPLGPNDPQAIRAFGRDWYMSGRAMLLLTPIIWSGYGVSFKYMDSLPWSLSLGSFNVLRLGIAALIVLPGLTSYLRSGGDKWRSAAVAGGLELGLWTFTVNLLQMLGLQHSSASIAAFLCQLNSIFVPFAAFSFGIESVIPPQVYIASLLSVAGVALVSLDDVSGHFSLQGEGVLLLSAIAATTFIIRSKTHASHTDFDAVLAVKIVTQFIIALLYFTPATIDFISAHHGLTASSLTGLFSHATPALLAINALVVAFNGVGVSWLSTFLQLKGQAAVPATEACVAFSSTPIWSALMAVPLGERFGERGVAGAALIVVATLLASIKAEKDGSKKQAAEVKES